MIFKTIVEYGKQNEKYLTFRPQDKNRYPHLDLKLSYNSNVDCYFSTDVEHNVREFLGKDLAIRELMIPSARRLFIKDMLGMPSTYKEKLIALNDVANWRIPEYTIEKIIPRGFGWEREVPLNLVRVKSDRVFPIGIVAKGTDIAIIDQNDSTYGQEVAHAVYHFAEGISRGGENITEVHGDPFFVYALQCFEGRLARRIRKGNSPHRIKFSDYICLRAYAGGKIREGIYHSALGILSPPMNLVASLVKDDTLIEALFKGSSSVIEKAIDDYLGKDAYKEIYLSYDVFGRLEKIAARGGQDAINRMFEKPLFKSELSQKEIRRIWENPKLRNDKLIERIA